LDCRLARDLREERCLAWHGCRRRSREPFRNIAQTRHRHSLGRATDLAVSQQHSAAQDDEKHSAHEQRKLPLEGHPSHAREIEGGITHQAV
jgi:hypothetical protein